MGLGAGMIEGEARIYLDHNATSPLRPEAAEAIRRAEDQGQANPSSLHAEGRAARALLEEARESVADLAGARPSEVVFTSGGSESIAAAVRGVCDRAPDGLRRIVVSEIEHSAVLEAAALASRQGFVVVKAPCNAQGRVKIDRFVMQLGEGVTLAALQWANNETGVIQPVEEIGRACRERGVPFLVDAAQAAGKIPLSPRKVFADLMTLSGHKLGGPQGTGALVVRSGIELAPLIGGGAQEKRRRGGTEAVAAIAGFGAAARVAHAGIKRETRRVIQLRAKLETRLREIFPDVLFHGQASSRLPNTVNFAIPGVPGETLVIAADLAGLALSTGSACASGAVEPSHVIQAMGFGEDEARASVRLSVGWNTTLEDIDLFLERFPNVVARVREGLSAPRG
jgi:cysteine desulfurase